VIRSAPRAIRQLGKGFYGVGCPHPGIECFVGGQIAKLLMHYGCSSTIGEKLKISYNQLVIELGLSVQPFQESFATYKEHVTWSWLVSTWEKCDIYGVKISMNDIPIELTRKRDKWMMWEFARVGYKCEELRWLNRVRLYQMVIFLSDVLGLLDAVLTRDICGHDQQGKSGLL
jgi:hypothetical protein